jgi:hypothetical protein
MGKKLYDKEDLLKLKASKPVPIIAHSGEVIVPVVYSGMVKKYLEGRGVKLPLTHHQLADMKREAKAVGGEPEAKAYARGGKVTKAKATAKATQQQNVIINLGKTTKRKVAKKKVPGIAGPLLSGSSRQPPQPPLPQERPNYFSSIRPFVQGAYQPNGPAVLNSKAAEDAEKAMNDRIKKATDEAIEKFKKEQVSRPNSIAQAIQTDAIEEKKSEPLIPSRIEIAAPSRFKPAPSPFFSQRPEPSFPDLSDVDEDREDLEILKQQLDRLYRAKREKEKEESFKEADRKIIVHDNGIKSPEYSKVNRQLKKLENEIEDIEDEIRKKNLKLKILESKK